MGSSREARGRRCVGGRLVGRAAGGCVCGVLLRVVVVLCVGVGWVISGDLAEGFSAAPPQQLTLPQPTSSNPTGNPPPHPRAVLWMRKTRSWAGGWPHGPATRPTLQRRACCALALSGRRWCLRRCVRVRLSVVARVARVLLSRVCAMLFLLRCCLFQDVLIT